MKRSAIHHMDASVPTIFKRALTLSVVAVISLLMVLFTAGCTARHAAAQGQPVLPVANGATGATSFTPEQLLAARRIAIDYGCSSCHMIGIFPEARGIFGPDLTHIGPDAGKVILTQAYKDSGGQATTGREYIRESILTPARFVATDCPKGTCPTGLMPLNFQQQFGPYPEDLNLLIDVLISLQ